MAIVHLLRHGEVHNPDRVLYGRLPGFGLSARGHEMAQIVADHLVDEGHNLGAIISSPLERAQQTAAPSAAAYGLTVTTDERLIEADSVFEGTRIGAEPWRLINPRYWPALRNPFRPSWGEPYRDQANRVLSLVEEVRKTYDGSEVLLVSHQLPIWVSRLQLEGKRLWHSPLKRECTTCSLTSLNFQRGELVGIKYTEPVGKLSQSLSAGSWSPK